MVPKVFGLFNWGNGHISDKSTIIRPIRTYPVAYKVDRYSQMRQV